LEPRCPETAPNCVGHQTHIDGYEQTKAVQAFLRFPILKAARITNPTSIHAGKEILGKLRCLNVYAFGVLYMFSIGLSSPFPLPFKADSIAKPPFGNFSLMPLRMWIRKYNLGNRLACEEVGERGARQCRSTPAPLFCIAARMHTITEVPVPLPAPQRKSLPHVLTRHGCHLRRSPFRLYRSRCTLLQLQTWGFA
jgi:hypothetical protein